MASYKLVSIITPAYNAVPFLKETIASVKAQTYEHWEWLVSDDGSDDGTVRIIAEAAEEDPRICLIPSAGGSRSAAGARNRAMHRAKGEFFAFLDADDLWDPEKTERQVNYLLNHPEADAVCCWNDHFGDEKRVRLEDEITNHEIFKKPVCERSDLIKQLPFQTSTLMMRRKCYEKIGDMDEDPRLRSGQDLEYFARLIASFNVHRIREVLAHYRLNPGKNSLKAGNLDLKNTPAWNVFEVMMEKGFYSQREARRKRSALYYDQAINNLFRFEGPFRSYLLKSVLSGCPPLRAVIALSLCFLSAPNLRRVLVQMLSIVNRWSLRQVKH